MSDEGRERKRQREKCIVVVRKRIRETTRAHTCWYRVCSNVRFQKYNCMSKTANQRWWEQKKNAQTNVSQWNVANDAVSARRSIWHALSSFVVRVATHCIHCVGIRVCFLTIEVRTRNSRIYWAYRHQPYAPSMPRNAWRWTVNRWGQQFLKCRIIDSNDNNDDGDNDT